MDNASRSERTRKAALQAALDIIARDGPARLTLDAIARESGISKGGVLHQFRTKEAVLKALLEHQLEHYQAFSRRWLAKHGATRAQPELAATIAAARESVGKPDPVAFALVGAVAQEPALLSIVREADAVTVAALRAEAPDPELALLRWSAARGLVLSALLGMCPLSERERTRLFERLLDDAQWPAPAAGGAAPRGKRR
jgi:AcrR family transcriptional regulator